MGLLKVEHFCCCWSVRAGTLFLGNITWFGCTLVLIALLYVYDLMAPRTVSPTPFHTVVGFQIFINCIAVVLSGCLIIGVLYKKPKLMMPYIIVLGLAVVLLGICSIGMPILAGSTTNFVALPFGVFFTFIIAMVIAAHCWLVVYTQYKEIKIGCGSAHTILTPSEEV